MNYTLPLFFYKPTLCWLDDDPLFLNEASSYYESHFPCVAFTDSQKAVEALKQYQSPLEHIQFTRELTENDLYGTQQHYPINMNISAIKSLMKSKDKHKELALIISDYNIPTLNGLEVFKQLESLRCQKILLTGNASHNDVINAFNGGLIHRFVQKDNEANHLLNQYINELVEQHFQEKSKPLINYLESSKPSALSDPAFITTFNQWRAQENIIEFYLINKQGSFIAKNNVGEIYYFIVFSEHDKKEFLALHDETPNEASPLLGAFNEGTHIPFFGADVESWDIPHADWDNHFYPAKIIQGRTLYYWTVVKE